MLLKHERDYCLGMDALVGRCSWHTNVINYALGRDALVTVWAYALGLGTRAFLYTKS